jgi:trigger factor
MDLKVSVKDGKDCQKVVSVEIGAEPIREEYEQFYREVGPKAKIPGFRPGKASREVLAMYFKEEAKQEVLKHLISHSYEQVIREKSLEPLGYPEVKDVQFDEKKLSYNAGIETRPKIKLSKVEGLKVKKEAASVTPAEVEESLKRIRESLAQYKAEDGRAVAWGDFIIADYVCRVDGKEEEKRNDDWFEIKEDEFLKGFSGQLVGVPIGEEKEVRIVFPENFGRKEWAGKEAVFTVTVKEIKVKALPEMNDDLAKAAGECQTLQELTEKVRKDLLAGKEREKEAEYEKALMDELLKHNKIDLPPRLLKKRKDYLLEQRLESAKRYEVPAEKLEEMKKTLEGELEKEAAKQVHLAFLLDEIAAKQRLTVSEEDYRKKYESLAERFRQPADSIEKYYKEHPEALEALYDQIRNEKAIEFIKQKAK